MKRVILLSVMVFLGSCTRKSSPTPKYEAGIPKEVVSNKDKCSDLDTLIARSWRLADAPHASHFHFYERNDTLVNKYFLEKFKGCLIGKKSKEITDKFGEASYKSLHLVYYEFFSAENTPSLCLKFWVRSDTVYALAYKNCAD